MIPNAVTGNPISHMYSTPECLVCETITTCSQDVRQLNTHNIHTYANAVGMAFGVKVDALSRVFRGIYIICMLYIVHALYTQLACCFELMDIPHS